MFKTFLLALIVCLSPSQTNLVSLDDASVPATLPEHCTLVESEYCHCTMKTTEGDVVETRWLRIDPSVRHCDTIYPPIYRRGVKVLVDDSPNEVCDANGDARGASACVEASACDFTIKGVDLYTHPDEETFQLSVSIATQRDLSDVSLRVVYKNTTEVPYWTGFDERHPILLVYATKGHVRTDALALYASVGNCSDVFFFSLDLEGFSYVDWVDEHPMYVGVFLHACVLFSMVSTCIMVYTLCKTQRWSHASFNTKFTAMFCTIAGFCGTLIGLYLFYFVPTWDQRFRFHL